MAEILIVVVVQRVRAGFAAPATVNVSVEAQLQVLGERERPRVAGHGHDGRHLAALRAPAPHHDALLLEVVVQRVQGQAHAPGTVHEAAHVLDHRRVARFRRARVARSKAKSLQEATQGDVVEPVEVHVHHPGASATKQSNKNVNEGGFRKLAAPWIDAKRRSIIRDGAKTAKEDREFLMVLQIQNIDHLLRPVHFVLLLQLDLVLFALLDVPVR